MKDLDKFCAFYVALPRWHRAASWVFVILTSPLILGYILIWAAFDFILWGVSTLGIGMIETIIWVLFGKNGHQLWTDAMNDDEDDPN